MADLYGQMFRKVLYPAWEERYKKRPTLTRQAFLEKTQWRSLDELSAAQDRDLRALIKHAYQHVPFYRRRFDAVGARREKFQLQFKLPPNFAADKVENVQLNATFVPDARRANVNAKFDQPLAAIAIAKPEAKTAAK